MNTKRLNENHIKARGLYSAITSTLVGLALKKYKRKELDASAAKLKIQKHFACFFVAVGSEINYTFDANHDIQKCGILDAYFIFGQSGISLVLNGKLVAYVEFVGSLSFRIKYIGAEIIDIDNKGIDILQNNYKQGNCIFAAICENGIVKFVNDNNQLFELSADVPNGKYYVLHQTIFRTRTRLFEAKKITPQFEMFKALGITNFQ